MLSRLRPPAIAAFLLKAVLTALVEAAAGLALKPLAGFTSRASCRPLPAPRLVFRACGTLRAIAARIAPATRRAVAIARPAAVATAGIP
jgi:hypothetical protein